MPEKSSQHSVVMFFALGGVLGLVFSFLVTFIPYSRVGKGMLDFSSVAIWLFSNPSFLFASTMLLVGFLIAKLQLLPDLITFSSTRVISGFILAAATYPVGLFCGLVGSILIPDSFPHLPYIGLIMSLGFVAIAAVAALRVIAGRWPPAFWKGIIVFCLGVPALTAAIDYLFSSSVGSRSVKSFLEASTVRGIPLLLVVAEIVLALLVGHWFYTVAHSNAPKPR